MWEACFAPPKRSAVFLGLLMSLLGPAAWGDETRLSIGGYDPVAYFTDGKPVPGVSEFEYVCTMRAGALPALPITICSSRIRNTRRNTTVIAPWASPKEPHKDTVDPQAWAIVDGKLYLTHTTRSLDTWRQNAAANIGTGNENWLTVKTQAEPAIVGPPCRGRPPSVVISFKDGGRRLLVGGQVAVDKHGNVVGKGDMRAQIEQVGKTIQACLEAAGANVRPSS